MSRVLRKPDFCICENKDADQLRGNREADQRLCFRYTDSTIPLQCTSYIRNFKPPAIFCGCTARFVWDQVGNPEDRFSHNEAHLIIAVVTASSAARVTQHTLMHDLVLVLLRFNVPVNNFSVVSGRSHRFLGITSTFWEVNVSCSRTQHGEGSAVAWWLMPRTPDPEVGGSSPTRVKPCCVLEQGTFTPQKVLVIPRKRWLRPNMTEKLFTGTLRINQPTTRRPE